MPSESSRRVCPDCGRAFVVPGGYADKPVKCPNVRCGATVSVAGATPQELSSTSVAGSQTVAFSGAPGPRPRPKTTGRPASRSGLKIALVAAGSLAAVVGVVLLIIFGLREGGRAGGTGGGEGNGTKPPEEGDGTSTDPGSPPPVGVITSLDNEEKIAMSVGLVFNAWDTIDENGLREETPYLPYIYTTTEFSQLPDELKPGMQVVSVRGTKFYIERVLGSAGSCFLVTPNGYAITNRHVVEEFDRITNATKKREKMKDLLDLEKADPILLVFFNGKEHKATVKFVHSKIDFAIIKIDGISSAPYFGLAASDEIKRGNTVIALGFPGAARESLPGEEGEAALRTTGKKMRDYLPPIAFNYVQTEGKISAPQDRSIGRLILHDATINHGNSGGPLVDDHAKVLGINTFGISDGGKQGTFMSVQMKQLRREIDQNISSVGWR